MNYLADANILLRLANPGDVLYSVANNAVNTLKARGDGLFIVPQSLYEFWAVATRPTTARGGLGLSLAAARAERSRLQTLFALLPDNAAILPAWEILVDTYGVSGVPSHDARLAAAMQVHRLTHLLTFNTADFTRYAFLTVVDPANV